MNWRLHPYKTVKALNREVKSLKRIINQDQVKLTRLHRLDDFNNTTIAQTQALFESERDMNEALALVNWELRSQLYEKYAEGLHQGHHDFWVNNAPSSGCPKCGNHPAEFVHKAGCEYDYYETGEVI